MTYQHTERSNEPNLKLFTQAEEQMEKVKQLQNLLAEYERRETEGHQAINSIIAEHSVFSNRSNVTTRKTQYVEKHTPSNMSESDQMNYHAQVALAHMEQFLAIAGRKIQVPVADVLDIKQSESEVNSLKQSVRTANSLCLKMPLVLEVAQGLTSNAEEIENKIVLAKKEEAGTKEEVCIIS